MSWQYQPQQPYNNDNLHNIQYMQQQPYNNPQYSQQPAQPQQGYPQQPPYQQLMMQAPKKRVKWPWVAGGCGCLTVLAIIGIVIIASSAATVSHVTGNRSNNSATMQSVPASSSNTIAKVGQTITVDDVSCTLVSVKTLVADEFNKPKSGYQYIVVHITMKNASNDQVSYNPFDFHIKSANGNVTEADFMTPASYTANNTLNSGNLDPNGSVDGDIIMQAPLHDTKAELTWAASIFSSNTQYGWILGS